MENALGRGLARPDERGRGCAQACRPFERERRAHVRLDVRGRSGGVRDAGERLDRVDRIAGELRGRLGDVLDAAVDEGNPDALPPQAQELLLKDALARGDDGREERDPLAREAFGNARGDRRRRARRDGHAAVRAMLNAEPHEEEPEEVVDLRHRRDGRAHAAPRRALLDRDRRGDAAHAVDVGGGRRLHHRARVGVEALEVAPLPLGEDDVEGERGLAGARGARDDGEGVSRDVDREVAQVVLARALDDDRALFAQQRLQRTRLSSDGRQVEEVLARGVPVLRPPPGAKGLARERARAHHRLGVALEDGVASGRAAFGAELDHPVGAPDDVEVVLDHDDRVSERDEPVEDRDELLDVGEVQARHGLVEDEDAPRAGSAPARGRADAFGDARGEPQALPLASGERREGLTEREVPEARHPQDVERPHDRRNSGEGGERLVDGEREHLGDALSRAVRQKRADCKDLIAVPRAPALRAGQPDVREKLHLHVLGARARAARTAPLAGVEGEVPGAEGRGRRFGRAAEEGADAGEGARVARRVAARGLAERALVDELERFGKRSRERRLRREGGPRLPLGRVGAALVRKEARQAR